MIGFHANVFVRMAMRLALMPVIAGIAYEVLKIAAKGDSLFVRIVRAPGMALQRMTTKPPDDDMAEVAITAFKAAMEGENGNER